MPAAPASSLDDTALRAAIEGCGARFVIDDYGPQAQRESPVVSFERLSSGALALLPDHGLIELTGEERVRFLQALTTNDIERQPAAQARWHGLCTPKGRLLATMLAWREESAIRLLLPRPLAEAVRKRLSMYVLRARVRVDDRSDAHAVLGLCGAPAGELLASLGLPAAAPYELASIRTEPGDADAATVIGLPAIGDPAADTLPETTTSAPAESRSVQLPRWLLIVPAASLPTLWPRLAQRLAPIDSAAWRWTDVRSGIARVVPATVEQFVPQMIDFDSVGGVSFDKGCYPGQEIVARSHYLGKVKRRLFLGHLAGPPPAPGAAVADANGEPIGAVVLAAPAPGGGTDLLLEAQAAALAEVAQPRIDGHSLRIGTLPYARSDTR
jgi:folate-binding protein YgfZ